MCGGGLVYIVQLDMYPHLLHVAVDRHHSTNYLPVAYLPVSQVEAVVAVCKGRVCREG